MLVVGEPLSFTGVVPGAGAGAGVVDDAVLDAGAAAAGSVDTPTPLPHAANSNPATSGAVSENTARMDLINGMGRLKYVGLDRAICRRLRT